MEIMVRAERHDELLDKEEELSELKETFRVVSERRDEADKRVADKDAEIARLRAALKPFAEFAKDPPPWLAGLADDQELLWTVVGRKTITIADCRAALKALEEA